MSFISFFASTRPPLVQAFAVGESPLMAIVHLPSSPAWAIPTALTAKSRAAMRDFPRRRLMTSPCDDRVKYGVRLITWTRGPRQTFDARREAATEPRRRFSMERRAKPDI